MPELRPANAERKEEELMQTMTITWNNGRGAMRLNVDRCFPCSVSWLRKLLRMTIDRSDHPEEYRADLVIYLNELQDVIDNEAEKKKAQEEILLAGYAAGTAKGEIDRLAAQEKALGEYVKMFVRRNDKENAYRKLWEDTRAQLKDAKQRYRIEIARERAAKRRIEKMERDGKNIRECLTLLGQEV